MEKIFVLLVLFQIKHFIADYPLQNKYMLGKFKEVGWINPLLAHVAVHGFLTAVIVAFFDYRLMVVLAMLDMSLHFIMDRIKASSKLLGRYESIGKSEFKGLSESLQMAKGALSASSFGGPSNDLIHDQAAKEIKRIEKRFKHNTYFWWALGLDQAVHHLTHYLIIYLIVS